MAPPPAQAGSQDPTKSDVSAKALSFVLNGTAVALEGAQANGLLIDLLRDGSADRPPLTGTHRGCETSQCGACLVLLDGRAVKSCTLTVLQAAGRDVTTIEGYAEKFAPEGESLAPVQRAFKAHHGLQCGFCTPGMVMAAHDYLSTTPQNEVPGDQEIGEALEGNLCRCTGYRGLVEAVSALQTEGTVPAAPARLSAPPVSPAWRPRTVTEALTALQADPTLLPLGGGQSLLPSLEGRRTTVRFLDLSGITDWQTTVQRDDTLLIGAGVTHDRLARDPLVQEALPALARLAGRIGDPAVRVLGTVGGALAQADPAGDYWSALFALEPLGARIETSAGSFEPAAFFKGPYETALPPQALITGLRLPLRNAEGAPLQAAYRKVRDPASRWALAGVFGCRFGASPAEGHFGVIGAADRPFRLPGHAPDASLEGLAFRGEAASPAYRRQLVRTLLKRVAEDLTPKTVPS